MEKVTLTIEIPIITRHGEGVSETPISDEDLAKNVSYVLNIFLQRYCRYIGAPKFGEISCNGYVTEA